MFLNQTSRVVRQQWRLSSRRLSSLSRPQRARGPTFRTPLSPPFAPSTRLFHESRSLYAVKPVLLADIGEGIVECEIIQWFVEPGARVEEFSPLCEVQSDKASVEITSRFAGVVKKLHYEAGEMAKVGKPFVDIDIQGDAKEEDLQALTPAESVAPTEPTTKIENQVAAQLPKQPPPTPTAVHQPAPWSNGVYEHTSPKPQPGEKVILATPAVRYLVKELNVDLSQIQGTGKEGRILKEDVYKFVEQKNSPRASTPSPFSPSPSTTAPSTSGQQQETPMLLTRTQEMMFKTMTRSLSIPHFLYADEVDFTSLVELRNRLNKVLAKSPLSLESSAHPVAKLSYLPFIIKAVSMALYKYPILNSRVDIDPATSKPSLVLRSQHNIGIAMDTPHGLLVPVIRNVGALNILQIAAELTRLQSLATEGKLSVQDMSGGTITVSNIGNIGGTYLSPVVVEKEVAILGIGRMRTVPAFGEDDKVVKKEICNFSWSADHRVVDGATMARAAEVVRGIVEGPDVMVMHLR
ncbi:2-oxoacid dehydrogenases acyltransferase-domain-containing protein [Apiosordaria backusii]|uniref:Dihydrolipoamide acetyltransferase component of pyruvate dehydrogenase complex n=1 Tax=Apiosordaria backusii TaxID=314023 RepID=A0AA40BP09_9PEZI|nr:2-oxoacid dehydrogenases acyltransferase-domain-containing protein [Apiosordaria backusii]